MMNPTNLAAWLKNIDATDLSEADKATAKAGLEREAKGTDAALNLDANWFESLFEWRLTHEGVAFWGTVDDALFIKKLHRHPRTDRRSKGQWRPPRVGGEGGGRTMRIVKCSFCERKASDCFKIIKAEKAAICSLCTTICVQTFLTPPKKDAKTIATVNVTFDHSPEAIELFFKEQTGDN